MYRRVQQDERRQSATHDIGGHNGKAPDKSDAIELTKLSPEDITRTKSGSPRYLPTSWRDRWTSLTLGIVLILLPVPFLVLGITALTFDHQPLSSMGAAVIASARVSPTIYPVVFAGVVARLFQNLARWRAEKGTSLGMLETFNRSQSLASSIITPWSLQLFGLFNILVVLLWALAPLGGQSSLRILSVETSYVEESLNVAVASYDIWAYTGGLARQITGNLAIEGIVRAALLTPASGLSSPIDIWTHVKVPVLSPIVHGTQPEGAWLDVDMSASNNYSSPVGIPMSNIPSTGRFTFITPWAYMLWDSCVLTKVTQSDYCDMLGQASNSTMLGYTFNSVDGTGSCNGTQIRDNQIFSNWDGTPLPLDGGSPNWINISYVVAPALYNNSVSITCKLSSVRQDLSVACLNGSCSVDKVRRSIIDTRPPWVTLINQWRSPSTSALVEAEYLYAVKLLLGSTGKTLVAQYLNPLENYLTGSSSAFSSDTRNWQHITPELFAHQMTQIWNAFWLVTMFTIEVVDDIHSPFSFGPNFVPSTALNHSDNSIFEGSSKYRGISGILETPIAQYKAHRGWIAILLCVTVLLEACAVFSLVLSLVTRAPDIIGWTSSLTRDNRHFARAQDFCNSTMNGDERARLLRNVKVQIADVEPDRDVGHIAFTCVDDRPRMSEEGGSQMRSNSGRLYD